MSKNKRFSSTSANRYSLALFELASESKTLEGIEKNSLVFLKLISEIKEFKILIKNPTTSFENLNNIINRITESTKMDKLFRNFLNFLISKRRFFYVEQILKNFITICSEKRGELNAEIKSAKSLTSDEINDITIQLSNNFKSKVKLNYVYDQSLIGGLIIKIGSTMIDTSIKNKLQQIENRMIEA